MDNILKRNAPVYFEQVNGCVIEWYDGKLNTFVFFCHIDLLNTIYNIFTDELQPNTIPSLKKLLPVNQVTMNANTETIVYY